MFERQLEVQPADEKIEVNMTSREGLSQGQILTSDSVDTVCGPGISGIFSFDPTISKVR